MQRDMHFHGVYCLARAAGLRPGAARTLAHASQYVDDAVDDELVVLDRHAILPVITSHKPYDWENVQREEQWNVWIPFHFVPGGEGETFRERIACRRGARLARQLLELALENAGRDWFLHAAGIALHAFADTYSHHGFAGLALEENVAVPESVEAIGLRDSGLAAYVEQKLRRFVRRSARILADRVAVGHGTVATFPDRPYMRWRYRRLVDEEDVVIERDNPRDYAACAREIFRFCLRVREARPDLVHRDPRRWGDVSRAVRRLVRVQAHLPGRIGAWRRALVRDRAFGAVAKEDRAVHYGPRDWQVHRALLDHGRRPDAVLFARAAIELRYRFQQELLPAAGLGNV